VVSSCDAYEDVWEPFFDLFFKYWPNCPFSVYLITNNKDYKNERVRVIKVGEDKGWASNTKKALNSLSDSHVILMLEDFFLQEKVDNSYIMSLLLAMRDSGAGYLRLYPAPEPDLPFNKMGEYIGLLSREASYRTSLMAAIWDKGILLDLLVDGENPWQMEMSGTERSRGLKRPFLSVKKDKTALNYFHHVIKKGMWYYDAVKFAEREGMKINRDKRRVETFVEYVLRKIKKIPLIGEVVRKVL